MDFRVLMVQSIALLFWEKMLYGNDPESSQLIIDLIEDMPNIDGMGGTDEDRENLNALRNIALTLSGKGVEITQAGLISKVKLSIKKDPELRQDVIELLSGELLDNDETLRKIITLRREIKEYFVQKKFKDEIRKINQRTLYSTKGFNTSKIASEIATLMENYAVGVSDEEDDPSINAYVDLNDPASVLKAFQSVQEDVNPESIIRTGWQGFNRMCGEVGGLRRGNMYVVGAMPSQGKSLVSTCITLHTALYNKPYMFDPNKKPVIVHFSTENDIPLNFKIMFRMLWEDEHQQPANILDMDPEAMSIWFMNKVQQNGYEVKFYHIDPTMTGYQVITNRLKELENKGYEIHLLTVDYLAMLTNDGLGTEDNRAFWIRQLFKVIRNYCNPRKITMITPHQVSTEAAMYKRQGTDDFVKQIAGKRFWSECRSIDMEVDMEVVVGIEKDQSGKSWMAFGRGKDRSSADTPEKDKFFFLPFSQYGGLRADINGMDTCKHSIKGDTNISIDLAFTGGDSPV